ncbi:MAG: FkbM family methyltransferase [Chloroflexi bacterium]|nr:MAG: FkbM family methyltransferase [Chloroflexota bacterium]
MRDRWPGESTRLQRKPGALARAAIKGAWLLYRLVPPSLRSRLGGVGRGAVHALVEADLFPAASFSLRHNGTSFKLYVVKDRFWAFSAYSRWADGTAVYERVMLECLTRLLRGMAHPGFIDVGAFMGHYACYATALLGDKEETYAIESNPQYYSALLRSIELNGFSKLKAFNVVLSDRVEAAGIDKQTVLLFEPQETRTHSMTLDELCRREGIRPKIVKIDVHGSEGKVLLGMGDIMSECLEYILLELSPLDVLRQYSGAMGRSDILTHLEQHGFHVFHMAGHRYPGSEGLRQALEAGFAYRRLNAKSSDLLLFDRPQDVFVLCSKRADLETILGPSVADPGLELDSLV